MSCTRGWTVAVFVLAGLLTILMGREVIFGGKTFVPTDFLWKTPPWAPPGETDARLQNRLHQDIVEFYAMHALVTTEALRNGRFYLWNAEILCGLAVVGDPQLGTFYPPRLLSYLLWPPLKALDVFILVHFFLAGPAMYLLARRLGAGPYGALVSSFAWMLCGQTMVWFKYGSGLVAAVLLPLMAAALVHAYERRSLAWMAAAGALWALLLTGSHPQLSFLALVWMGIFGASRWGSAGWRWSLQGAAAFAAVGIGLGAVQLFPFLESLAASGKAETSADASFTRPWRTPLLLVTLLWQRAFGSPIDRLDVHASWLGVNFFEFQGYMGWTTLGLALVTLASRNRPATLWIAAGTALAVATIYPLWWAITAILPFLAAMIPHRLFLWAFSVALLAGLGFDRALERPPGRKASWLAGAAIGAVVLIGAVGALRGSRWVSLTQASYAALLLAAVGAGIALAVLRSGARTPWKAAVVLGALAVDLLPGWLSYNAAHAVALPPIPSEISRLPRHGRVLLTHTTAFWGNGVRNYLMPYGLPTPVGFASQYPRAYREFLSALGADGTRPWTWEHPSSERALRLLNVRSVSGPDGDRTVDALPYAWLVGEAEVLQDRAERLRRLADPAFDPARSVLLERPPPIEPAPDAAGTVEPPQPGIFQVSCAAPAILVISENYHPGWECRVNGTPYPVLRANHSLQAVALPAGTHRLEWRFRPASVRYGAWVSALTLLAAASSIAASRAVRARRWKASAGGGR